MVLGPATRRTFRIHRTKSNHSKSCRSLSWTNPDYGSFNKQQANQSFSRSSHLRKSIKRANPVDQKSSNVNANSRQLRQLSAYRRYVRSNSSKKPKMKNPLRRSLLFLRDSSPINENTWVGCLQILVCSLLICVGNVSTGHIIVHSYEASAFIDIQQLYIIIPMLLGLKNILEMTMVSRITTEANLGNLNKLDGTTIRMITADLALVFYQTTTISFVGSIFSVALVSDPSSLSRHKYCIILASTVISSSLAGIVVGIIMSLYVFTLNRFKLDPDNFSMPLAIALGDTITAWTFRKVSTVLYEQTSVNDNLPLLILVVFACILMPIAYKLAANNAFTKKLIHSGWPSMMVAMLISCCSGHFLYEATTQFHMATIFEPIICGMSRNFVSMSISKLSTMLHLNYKMGQLPVEVEALPVKFGKVFFDFKSELPFRTESFYNISLNLDPCADINSKLNLFLQAIMAPLQAANLFIMLMLNHRHEQMQISISSTLLYLTLIQFQIILMLYISYNLVHFLWLHKINPDEAAMPVLLSLSDMFAIFALIMAFKVFYFFNEPFVQLNPPTGLNVSSHFR